MKRIWLTIEGLDISAGAKNKMFLILNMVIAAALGVVIWAVLGQWVLPGGRGLLIFAGYPAMFLGLYGSIVYLWNNQFS